MYPKMKKNQFKVINNVYPAAEILRKTRPWTQNYRYRLRLEIFVYFFICILLFPI